MVLGHFRDLFGIIATSAATLTGLLFVAMSVSRSRSKAHPPVIREFRAAAALLAFTNALAVSLFEHDSDLPQGSGSFGID